MDNNARFINVGNCSSGTVKINPSQGGQSGTEKSSAAKTIKDKKSVKDDSAESTNENVNDDNDDDTDVSIVDSGTADSAVKDYSNILIVIIICAAVVISVAVISITIYFLKTKDKLQKY